MVPTGAPKGPGPLSRIEGTYLAADTCRMAKKPEPPKSIQLDPLLTVCVFHVVDVVARSWRRVRSVNRFSRGSRVALKGIAQMIRFVIAVGVVVLLGDSALADDRCEQVKQAVATYGYAAARKHALENYGMEAVAFGDKCLRESGGRHRLEAAEPKLGTGRANPRLQSFRRP